DGAAAGALRPRRAPRSLAAAARRRRQGPDRAAAARRRLDGRPRPAGAAGPDLPGAMAPPQPAGGPMTDAKRQAVLRAARDALGSGVQGGDDRAELADGTARPRANLHPPLARLPRKALVDLFGEKAEAVACTVRRIGSAAEVPAAVMDYLRTHSLPAEVTVAPAAELAAMPWDDEPLLTRRTGAPRNEDLVGVTPAFAGVAETGTLVMLSGPEHPATLNFMPDHHIVALPASRIVGVYEEAWAALRRRGGMPRNVN